MNTVYLDNAATTAVRPEVVEAITTSLLTNYGNPSSVYGLGRQAKSALELARKSIAKSLNVSSQEIIFCSGGTEADNWALIEAVKSLKVERIISARTEHHAVLHTLDHLQKEFGIEVEYVKLKKNGAVDISHLSEMLSDAKKTLVSLMHVNNETGTITDIELIGKICKQYNAYFHSDTVQSVGKMNLNFSEINIDFFAASAHKFHGPKGVGFLFVRKGTLINPMIFGGAQEKGLRAGTESVHNIVGMAKALEMSFENLEKDCKHISELKKYAAERLLEKFTEDKKSASWNFAIEFRNPSWYDPQIMDFITSFNASMVLHDMNNSSTGWDQVNADFIYLRFHGPEPRYRGNYSEEFLKERATSIQNWLSQGKTVYAYFNNTLGEAYSNLRILNKFVHP